jgi:hypothetical protein
VLGSAALDTAIGLVLVYLLLSLMCSAITELLETWLKHRSIELDRGIRQLLADPDGVGLARQFYQHPLIASLFRGGYDAETSRNLPSYIPSRQFALALMDLVLPSQPSMLSGAAGAIGGAGTASPVAPLRDAVARIEGADAFRRTLFTLIDAAGNDIVQVRTNIEQWFDAAMDRVSGYYKRRSQKILVSIGILIAVLMNVSSITIAKALWTDQTLRDSMTKLAQDYLDTADPSPGSETPQQRFDHKVKALQSFSLPIGWTSDAGDPRAITETDPGLWFERLFGWLLTGCAVSLGAPFWFDMLNKFTVVRSTVKPHEKSPERSSKD